VLYEPVDQTIGVVSDRRAATTALVNVDFGVFTNSAIPSFLVVYGRSRGV